MRDCLFPSRHRTRHAHRCFATISQEKKWACHTSAMTTRKLAACSCSASRDQSAELQRDGEQASHHTGRVWPCSTWAQTLLFFLCRLPIPVVYAPLLLPRRCSSPLTSLPTHSPRHVSCGVPGRWSILVVWWYPLHLGGGAAATASAASTLLVPECESWWHAQP